MRRVDLPLGEPGMGEWRFLGACLGRDDVEWFPDLDVGESPEVALSLCRSCVVRAECASYAVNTRQEFGIWGGMTEYDRNPGRTRRRAAQSSAAPRAAEPWVARPSCPACGSRLAVVTRDSGHLTCLDCRIVWSASFT